MSWLTLSERGYFVFGLISRSIAVCVVGIIYGLILRFLLNTNRFAALQILVNLASLFAYELHSRSYRSIWNVTRTEVFEYELTIHSVLPIAHFCFVLYACWVC